MSKFEVRILAGIIILFTSLGAFSGDVHATPGRTHRFLHGLRRQVVGTLAAAVVLAAPAADAASARTHHHRKKHLEPVFGQKAVVVAAIPQTPDSSKTYSLQGSVLDPAIYPSMENKTKAHIKEKKGEASESEDSDDDDEVTPGLHGETELTFMKEFAYGRGKSEGRVEHTLKLNYYAGERDGVKTFYAETEAFWAVGADERGTLGNPTEWEFNFTAVKKSKEIDGIDVGLKLGILQMRRFDESMQERIYLAGLSAEKEVKLFQAGKLSMTVFGEIEVDVGGVEKLKLAGENAAYNPALARVLAEAGGRLDFGKWFLQVTAEYDGSFGAPGRKREAQQESEIIFGAELGRHVSKHTTFSLFAESEEKHPTTVHKQVERPTIFGLKYGADF